MVAGFAQSAPSAVLLRFAERERRRPPGRAYVLDVGCGAARNAIPLIHVGWDVIGVDLSSPMLGAAAQQARQERIGDRLHLILAPMDQIPRAAGHRRRVMCRSIRSEFAAPLKPHTSRDSSRTQLPSP
jgi:SAM-dependent methyltransferase